MNPLRNPLHVIVAGGGIAGLCLAQGLRASGVDVRVHERDDSPAARAQGYRLGLKETGARALRECLPGDLYRLCRATAIRTATRMIFLDEQLRPRFQREIPPPPGGDDAPFGVNRLTLREILLTGLEDVVRFGSAVERYEPAPGGRVRVVFADGSQDVADLLVGADGTGSAVRRQLVPDAVIDELDRAVWGRTPITPALLDRIPPELVDSFNRVLGPAGAALSVATCRTPEPPSRAAARIAPRACLTDVPGYFSWMVAVPGGERPSAPADLHRLAARTVETWHPALGDLVAAADRDGTFGVSITSARPVRPWAEPAVTLLGDAIHTMSPGRGDGANVALQHAALLSRLLAGRASLAEAKQAYETRMLRDGFAAVERSRQAPFAPFARTGGAR
ncbi:FAD-dependent monooxygenase [Actinomadura sp. ATCC 31491]|uniref:FAD-dependent monooxygenase n=1 Tax=Actinomadura luzonensis TaxID=2805427 RepID=A0ABT0FP02_9ACTN|nr:NAD(P)/FAD-dependent oxidoreductase [Actinomadura luzonensis]MCK2213735.1 FAD-dependent monooxygenase [Actinomadura luzonensis]